MPAGQSAQTTFFCGQDFILNSQPSWRRGQVCHAHARRDILLIPVKLPVGTPGGKEEQFFKFIRTHGVVSQEMIRSNGITPSRPLIRSQSVRGAIITGPKARNRLPAAQAQMRTVSKNADEGKPEVKLSKGDQTKLNNIHKSIYYRDLQ